MPQTFPQHFPGLQRVRAFLPALALLAALAAAGIAWAGEATAADAPAGAQVPANAGEAHLALSADKKEALVGAPVVVTLRLTAPAGAEVVEWPATESRLGDFGILMAERPVLRKGDQGRAEVTLRLRAACYDTGDHALGPVTVRWRVAGAGAAVIATESEATTITIRSVLPADAQATQLEAKPVRPPVALPMDRRVVALICASAALLALLLVALVVWLVRRRRAAAARPVPPPPLLDPDEEALRALAEMEMTGAAEHDTADALYTRLSFVLRRYLGRRYRFDALDMTSGELLGTLERGGWGEELWRLLRADLAEADFVKFARHAPPRARRAEAIARVREIVVRSRPQGAAAQTAETEHA